MDSKELLDVWDKLKPQLEGTVGYHQADIKEIDRHLREVLDQHEPKTISPKAYEDWKQNAIGRANELRKVAPKKWEYEDLKLDEDRAEVPEGYDSADENYVPTRKVKKVKMKVNEQVSEIVFYVLSQRKELAATSAEEIAKIADDIVNRCIVSKVIREDKKEPKMKMAPEPSSLDGMTQSVSVHYPAVAAADDDEVPF